MRRSLLTFLWLIVALLLLMSLISYSANDPSWSHLSTSTDEVSNLAGQGGAWLADILYTFIGAASWWLIVIACYEGWRVWCTETQPNGALRTLGYLFLIIATAAFTGLLAFSWLSQGIIGQVVGNGLSNLLSYWGALLFLVVFLVITLTFTFNLQWLSLFKRKERSEAVVDNTSDKSEPSDLPEMASVIEVKEKSSKTGQLPLPLTEADSQQNDSDPTSHKENSHQYLNTDSYQTLNPLDEFLDESGLSEIKDYEWLAENDATTPFKPVSSTYLANSKLTKKLDAKLENEIIKTPRQPSTVKLQPAETIANQAVLADESIAPSVIAEAEPMLTARAESLLDSLDSTNTHSNDYDAAIEPVENIEHRDDEYSFFSVNALPRHEEIERPANQNFLHDTSLEENVAYSPNVDEDNKSLLTPALAITDNASTAAATTDEMQTHVTQQRPTSSRSVESAELELTEHRQTIVPLDIHNDELFSNKSRAMQTSAYRASLSPLPELSLLDLPDPDRKPSYSREELQQLSELLEIKLQEFNIKAEVVNAQMGPVVTRFEVALAPGVKASKVTGIAKDLARSMSMASVRVVEVIPGKPYIGIEVPNPHRQMVRLVELLQTDAYQDPNGLLSMAMGKDIAGRPVIADLAKAPHMLVAGTTGSGKSVLVNSLLLSMLLKYTPQQLRLILIDPKQLELANYNDIPHLLTPVVTDMTEAASSLSWSVAEMERRYQLMSLFKVRKLDEFNKKVIASEENGHPLLDPLWRINDSVSQDKPPKLKPLPQIVIVADEFADMIMQVGKQAEELITRLAQKSRAAGIHLILATQRPSVDVITGLIKANIPVRAALRVNSKVDSRTILDAGGAEDMLGHGDMLFLGPGQIEPNRVHGAFISDAEVNRVCDAWRERGSPDYIDNMFDNFELSSPSGSGESSGGTGGEEDPLYDEVVAFLLETRKVSASSIQRKFSIGYNRAARIVDAMEAAGLVSGMTKSGKRELLM